MNEENKKSKEAICELEVTFSVVGGRWKPLILWFLKEYNTLRFGQLQHLIPDITHKILTKQLRDLEENQLIERKVYPEVPPRVEYSITECGKEIVPILEMMCDWAHKNNFFGYDLKYDICDIELDESLKLDNTFN